MTNNKLIIWALFDDGLMCYYNSLKNNDLYEVHSIGLREHLDIPTYHNIDLSLSNPNLLKSLSLLPHPDIIIASPPCESWSKADANGRIWQSIQEESWSVKNYNFYVEYNKNASINKKRDFYSKEAKRIIGEETMGATAYIIKKFKPLVWVIENPYSSLAWSFLKYHHNLSGYDNVAHYASYNSNYSQKKTIFFSNIELALKHDDSHLLLKNDLAKGNYDTRSSIPQELVVHIFNLINEWIIEKL